MRDRGNSEARKEFGTAHGGTLYLSRLLCSGAACCGLTNPTREKGQWKSLPMLPRRRLCVRACVGLVYLELEVSSGRWWNEVVGEVWVVGSCV